MSVAIEWPWQYNFPPFFTLQPHAETRERQIKVWRTLVLDYCRTNRQSFVDVREAANSPLFSNATINRKLTPEFILAILSDLQRTQHAAPVDKQKSRWEIYWHTLEEFAAMVHEHVKGRGATNSVLTLFELAQGEDVDGEPFFNLHEDILTKALKILEERSVCELMFFDDQKGVKFF